MNNCPRVDGLMINFQKALKLIKTTFVSKVLRGISFPSTPLQVQVTGSAGPWPVRPSTHGMTSVGSPLVTVVTCVVTLQLELPVKSKVILRPVP